MTLRKFKAAVSSAATAAAQQDLPVITGVSGVGHGDSDGEVVIYYSHPELQSPIRVQALAQDVSGYPESSGYLLFTDCENVPETVLAAMTQTQDRSCGATVQTLITSLANALARALSRSEQTENEDTEMRDADDPDEQSESIEDADDDHDNIPGDDDFSGFEDEECDDGMDTSLYGSDIFDLHWADTVQTLQRIKCDLREARLAGLKVAVLSGINPPSNDGLVSISIRINRLELSEGTLDAWGLSDAEYLVLLIRWSKPYIPVDKLIELPVAHSGMEFRIGACDRYKPSLLTAHNAFAGTHTSISGPQKFRKIFISNSLDQLLTKSFLSILKIKWRRSVSWDVAIDLEHKISTAVRDGNKFDSTTVDADIIPDLDTSFATRGDHHILPDGDWGHQLLNQVPILQRSLPLTVMEFALRYFTNCTKFCLRCHRRLDDGFEALKPYVCSNPLCLFQYMTMGLGPDVEQEIIAHPTVVDLLVSLCYCSLLPSRPMLSTSGAQTALHGMRNTFPVGLHLRVPNIWGESNSKTKPIEVMISAGETSLKVFAVSDIPRLKGIRWVALRYVDREANYFYHARIEDVNDENGGVCMQIMSQGNGTIQNTPGSPSFLAAASASYSSPAHLYPYEVDFDLLDTVTQIQTMRHILDTIPPIEDIRAHLASNQDGTLRSFAPISPAAATLLEWIVSSNLSFIRENFGQEKRIPFAEDWLQFQFAQGSPEKELRFNQALTTVAARKQLGLHPTIFAWHGSPASNWHSILRGGLDFGEISSGRVYGNGVYFSPVFSTSQAYSSSAVLRWTNSALKIGSIMSLNEIVNAPDEFVSSDPHYVVSELDWHQCRYLFVQLLQLKRGQIARITAATNTVQAPRSGSLPGSFPGVGTLRASNASLSSGGQVPSSNRVSALATAAINATISTVGALLSPGAATVEAGGSTTPLQRMLTQAPGLEAKGPDDKVLQIPLDAMPVRSLTGSSPLGRASRVMQILDEESEEDREDMDFLDGDEATNTLEHGDDTAASALAVISSRTLTAPPTPKTPAADPLTDFKPGSLDLSTLPRLAAPDWATDFALKATSRELNRLRKVLATTPLHQLGWYIDFDKITNLCHWIVELHSFDPTLPLAQDMKRAGITSVILEIRFGKDFPISPPFVRVVRPIFLPFMHGGGGHVTVGGAICLELLTSDGWSPANSIESVLVQVRAAICSTDPRPARLHGARGDYQVGDAAEAYRRAAFKHGWKVPGDFEQTANMHAAQPN